jgi:hypothetical protein
MLSDEFNRYAPLNGGLFLINGVYVFVPAPPAQVFGQPLFGLFADQTKAEDAEDERQPFECYDDWRERISPFAPSRLPNPF